MPPQEGNRAGKIKLIKKQEDSLKKRYFYKLLTNLSGLCIGACTQAIIPRGLGPKAYGDYNFLVNFFTQFINFFDMGSSIGFYTKLSQRPKEFKLISFYLYFVWVVTIIIVFFVALAQLTGLYNILWPNQLLAYVYLSIFLGLLIWVTNIMTRIGDAYGLTISTETAKIIQRIFGLVIIVTLFICNKLSLRVFFFYNYFILALLIGVFYYLLREHGCDALRNWKMPFVEIKKYATEFYSYSQPLFLYSLVVMLTGMFDKWLLQICSGSVEQGFFGLSYQIGAICFMFTSAMTPLIMREFSIAYNNKDMDLMAHLFRKHVPLLYSITALLACFTAVNADKAAIIMGGGRFQGAIPAVAIMAFFPIHQVYGQLGSSVFYASDRVKIFSNIAVVFMLLSLPLTYFLVAPRKFFGLNTGALGLSCAMVLMQFLSVNVQLYFNSKLLKFSFWKYLAHQLGSVAVFLIIAIFARLIIDYILPMRAGIIVSFMSCGILYLTIAFIFIYFFPIVIGTKKDLA